MIGTRQGVPERGDGGKYNERGEKHGTKELRQQSQEVGEGMYSEKTTPGVRGRLLNAKLIRS